jgi:hypothetical protein
MTKEQKLRELKASAVAKNQQITYELLCDNWDAVFALAGELRGVRNEVRLLIEPEPWRESTVESDRAAMLCPIGEDRKGESR